MISPYSIQLRLSGCPLRRTAWTYTLSRELSLASTVNVFPFSSRKVTRSKRGEPRASWFVPGATE
jgi:hypothetical protein